MSDLNSTLSSMRSRYLTTDSIARSGLPFSRVLIFGAGHRGNCIYKYFVGLKCQVLAFLDNNPAKQGTTQNGLPVLSFKDAIVQYSGITIFIASHHWKAIVIQLQEAGIIDFFIMPNLSFYFCPMIRTKYSTEVNRLYEMMGDENSKQIFASIVKAYETGDDGFLMLSQYHQYDHPIVHCKENDIVIDGGAFNGDTALQFHAAGAGRVVSFEPFSDSYAALEKQIRQFGNKSVCINKAVWSGDDTLRFMTWAGSAAGNSVGKYGATEIEATSIDIVAEELKLEKVDMIKLDVEGSELQALEGAKETITRHLPKIQICLYHNLEDLWELPLYLADNYPDYVFYIGHHALDPHETVLYTIRK